MHASRKAVEQIRRNFKILPLRLKLGRNNFPVEYDLKDRFVQPKLYVAFNDELAGKLAPLIFDHPKGYGSKPVPPEIMAYRLVVDPENRQASALFEVYWKKQDCDWRNLNKDHDHDYEQIQVHFNIDTGEVKRVVISSTGPKMFAGHGVEVYAKDAKHSAYEIDYRTSSKKFFPWGGKNGRPWRTQVRQIPLDRLVFDEMRPKIFVLNCYHVFTGVRINYSMKEHAQLFPQLVRLDAKMLDKWYYRYKPAKTRFGHDISDPFREPYVMYHPPPKNLLSRIAYGLLRLLGNLKEKLFG